MITKIEVDGFKSLTNFELKLNSGLNILVGPNGAGKTNIILFFEFLSQLVKSPLAKAVSAVGGAGTIFKKIGQEKYQDYIRFKIYGCHRENSQRFIVYEYEAIVKTSFAKDILYFSKQIIKVRTASKFWSDPDAKFYSSPWDLNISYNNIESKNERLKIHSLDRRKFKARYFLPEKGSKSASARLQRVLIN